MSEPDGEGKKEDGAEKLFEYIAFLESTNDSLLFTLRQCVFLLSQYIEISSNPKGLEEIIDSMNETNETISIGERVVNKKTLH